MSEQQAEKRKPNILFLIADDHRFDGIGAYGNPVVQTPVLDQLAAEGILYESIYTMGGLTAALCVPCRASLLTGTNVFQATASEKEVSLGQTENHALWNLNPELTYLPELFRQDGYRTMGIGKWHNGKKSFARSFSDGASIFFGGMGDHIGLPIHDYDPEGVFPDTAAYPSETFSSELFADAAIDWIQSHDATDPFLMYVAFTAPHDPRTPPQAYSDRYPVADIPLPANFMTEHPFDNGELTVRDEQLASFPRTPEEIRQHLADYYSMITHLDDQIGRILHSLKDSPHADNTIIVYTADHGLALGQHGLLGKQNLYEHSIHIPLIMKGPGLPSGVRLNKLGCQMDIYPTLCELAGNSVPETVEGRSMLTQLNEQQHEGRQYVYAVYKNHQRMVKDERWKLIRYLRSGDSGTNRTQLFDMQHDPWEMQDLSEEPAMQGHLIRLENELRSWQKQVQDPLLQHMNA
jgi:arylsulfatase A-like enzyme